MVEALLDWLDEPPAPALAPARSRKSGRLGVRNAEARGLRDLELDKRETYTGGVIPSPVWPDDELPFHSPSCMRRDCEAALTDGRSWLTMGYTAALHLRYLLDVFDALDLPEWRDPVVEAAA